MLRRCPLAIVQRLVHCAIAVSTVLLGQSHKDNVRCTAVDETTLTTLSKRGPTCSAQLHLPIHDLFWANLRVQLHLPPLGSLDLLISPGTLRSGIEVRSFLYQPNALPLGQTSSPTAVLLRVYTEAFAGEPCVWSTHRRMFVRHLTKMTVEIRE